MDGNGSWGIWRSGSFSKRLCAGRISHDGYWASLVLVPQKDSKLTAYFKTFFNIRAGKTVIQAESQSTGLLSRWLRVRISPGAPFFARTCGG
jgi:hypothetical protein